MSDVPSAQRRQLDYQLDDQIDADEPRRLKALSDPARMMILDLVLERAMSVTELAARLDRPKGSVAYHVNVLLDSGLLQVVRTQRVRAIEERYYGRVARTIVFPHEQGEIPFLRHVVDEIDLARLADKSSMSAFTFRRVRISNERAAEYAARLHALALEFIDEPRDGDVVYGMYLGVFPTTRTVRGHE